MERPRSLQKSRIQSFHFVETRPRSAIESALRGLRCFMRRQSGRVLIGSIDSRLTLTGWIGGQGNPRVEAVEIWGQFMLGTANVGHR